MSWVKKVLGFVFKDVASDNETKKVAIIIRLKSMLMGLYILMQSVLFMTNRLYPMALAGLLFLVAYAVAFSATYSCKTKNVVIYVQSLTLVWILLFVVMLGWDCGAQHFLFVLLVFNLLGTFRDAFRKMMFATTICIIRISLYIYCRYSLPYYPSALYDSVAYQVLNTCFVFATMTSVVIMFAQNSILMEKKLVDYNERICKMAATDPLTLLFNRRFALEYIEKLVDQATTQGDMFNIAIGDIDHFKKVNDTYGHEAGDEVLKRVAEVLGKYMKKRGLVARWGGEEFLFVFEGVNGDVAAGALEDLRSIVSKIRIPYEDQEIAVTMTFGLEEFDHKSGIDKVIYEADKKLYMGKETGRDRVIF